MYIHCTGLTKNDFYGDEFIKYCDIQYRNGYRLNVMMKVSIMSAIERCHDGDYDFPYTKSGQLWLMV